MVQTSSCKEMSLAFGANRGKNGARDAASGQTSPVVQAGCDGAGFGVALGQPSQAPGCQLALGWVPEPPEPPQGG